MSTMGRLLVVEGLDGSGKRTLTAELVRVGRARGQRIASIAFPRYGESVTADLVRDALYGRVGDLSDSVYGCAVLFGLDRAAAGPRLQTLLVENDTVLVDRYVSSNAAYGSARLGGPDSESGFAEWVREFEIDRLGVRPPDAQILLAPPLELAVQRARGRAQVDPSRPLDRFESDAELQRRTAAMYEQLANTGYLSPWRVLRPDSDGRLTIQANLLD